LFIAILIRVPPQATSQRVGFAQQGRVHVHLARRLLYCLVKQREELFHRHLIAWNELAVLITDLAAAALLDSFIISIIIRESLL
jgi:hypothetical protein